MNEQSITPPDTSIPEPLIRKKNHFSMIWILPLIAAVIGGWLVYKSIWEKGPVISIIFDNAEGLEAGKTKIKYKNVVIGQVESIKLDADLGHVIVMAQMDKDTESYLTEKTRFWVVRARLKAGQISGLGTLFAGAYIAVDPVHNGMPSSTFKGLDTPPVVTMNKPGGHFILKAERLGSLDIGSPVFYRQIQVGQVEGYLMDDDGKHLSIKIFIDAPHHRYIKKNTRFWNASGLDVSINANGLTIDTQSMVSLIIGGIAFDNLMDSRNNPVAENNDIFTLFDSHGDAMKKDIMKKYQWLLVFKGSVRGLTKGAPVEFRGIHVGEVLDIDTVFKLNSGEILISVLIETQLHQFLPDNTTFDDAKMKKLFNTLVAKGFRAQLKPGNILTGQLFVNLDFHPREPEQKIIWEGKTPQLPTIPATLEEAFAVFNKLLNRMGKIPFEEMAHDLRMVVKNLNRTVKQGDIVLKQINRTVTPELGLTLKQVQTTLKQAKKSLAAVEHLVGSDSALNQDARNALNELAAAAQSMRMLTDYLERHPDALIYGKGDKK
ncbi:paraquat-inducible protein B [Desulfocicer vacuolatum DSM 3385]|uniref:Paraquat-inducible protein B n=1 Tax=Desulfocicer vacuolatum DSM 3385 TaxID=1121400 RepID=A0A1W2EKU6_9BACT|nr:MlaD family protein [Desulfocicer vacuolatum]SMD10317.1 paraquat-inducible protein B [Desulfocicer vacuolatum DSM 3385]